MKKYAHNALAVILSPRAVIGAYLSSNPSSSQLNLHRLHYKKLDHLELEKLILFNSATIGSTLSSWQQQSETSAPLLCALQGPLQEQLVMLHNAHPTENQLPISHAPHWEWQYTYLYSLDHQHCFYLCGIKKTMIFQYQLMAITHGLTLNLLTTERMALLHCYRLLNGAAYRATQLANAMSAQHNRIEQLFFKEDLPRILQIPPHITITDEMILPLLTACGLFNAQG